MAASRKLVVLSLVLLVCRVYCEEETERATYRGSVMGAITTSPKGCKGPACPIEPLDKMRRTRLPFLLATTIGQERLAAGHDDDVGKGHEIDGSLGHDDQGVGDSDPPVPPLHESEAENVLPDFLLSENSKMGCDPFAEDQTVYTLPLEEAGYVVKGESKFGRQGLYQAVHIVKLAKGKYLESRLVDKMQARKMERPETYAVAIRMRFCNPGYETKQMLIEQCLTQADYAEKLPFGVVGSYHFYVPPVSGRNYYSPLECFHMPKMVNGKPVMCTSQEIKDDIAAVNAFREGKGPPHVTKCPQYCFCLREFMRGSIFDGLPSPGLPEYMPLPYLNEKGLSKDEAVLSKSFQWMMPGVQMLPISHYFYKNAEYVFKFGNRNSMKAEKQWVEVDWMNPMHEGFKHNWDDNDGMVLVSDRRKIMTINRREKVNHDPIEVLRTFRHRHANGTLKMGLLQLDEDIKKYRPTEGDRLPREMAKRLPASWKNAKDTFWRLMTTLMTINTYAMHSMVKPSNILLSTNRFFDDKFVRARDFDNPKPVAMNVPKLDDFGFAGPLVRKGDPDCPACEGYAFYEASTPDYTPPELLAMAVFQDRDIFILPHQLDIFAVAVILFEYTTATNLGVFLEDKFEHLKPDQSGNINYFSPEWNREKLAQMMLATDPEIWVPLFHSLRDDLFMSHQGQWDRDIFHGHNLKTYSHENKDPSAYAWYSDFERSNRLQAIEFIKDCISNPLLFERCDDKPDPHGYCDITKISQVPDSKAGSVCCKSKRNSGCKSAEHYLEEFAFFRREVAFWH